jgi:molybdate transport system substrate-binding protein
MALSGDAHEAGQRGPVNAGSRVDLARSSIGLAVRAGARKPDIRSVEGLKQALLAAQSVAYSASVSCDYLVRELFPRLGTVFSASIAAGSKHTAAAGALISFPASPAASSAVVKSGMAPVTAK